MSTSALPRPVARRPLDPGRVRAWLAAAVALLLAGVFLVAWTTWTALHLTPREYDQLPPGATALQRGASFRLLALTQSPVIVDRYDGPKPAFSGSVWVVADLELVQEQPGDPFCALELVDDQRRVWGDLGILDAPSREQETCLPDDVQVGQTARVQRVWQVPEATAAHLAGVAVDRFDPRPVALLTPG